MMRAAIQAPAERVADQSALGGVKSCGVVFRG
jgi:hypothetical protein